MKDFVHKKNNWIEFCRVTASLAILCHHSYWAFNVGDEGKTLFFGAYIFVEYFFMISGYFTAKHFSKPNIKDSILKFMVNKYKKIFPYVIICVFLEYLFLMTDFFKMGVINYNLLPSAFYETLLLKNFGLTFEVHYGVLWYLSAMLIALPVLCWLNEHANSFFHSLFLPFTPLFIWGGGY